MCVLTLPHLCFRGTHYMLLAMHTTRPPHMDSAVRSCHNRPTHCYGKSRAVLLCAAMLNGPTRGRRADLAADDSSQRWLQGQHRCPTRRLVVLACLRAANVVLVLLPRLPRPPAAASKPSASAAGHPLFPRWRFCALLVEDAPRAHHEARARDGRHCALPRLPKAA